MFGKERKGIDNINFQSESPDRQRNIEYSYIFLTQDQERMLTVEPGSYDEEALAQRIVKRTGNLTDAIRGAGERVLRYPYLGFPAFMQIKEEDGVVYYYFTQENEVKKAKVKKGRFKFLDEVDYSSIETVPPEIWGKDATLTLAAADSLVVLLSQNFQNRFKKPLII